MRDFRNLIVAGLALASCLLIPAIGWAAVTADDFLPPAQGGPTSIKEPDKVTVQGNTVTAASGQDAVNAAVKKNVEELAGGGGDMEVKMVKFSSGLGVVATGIATYRTMENATATRLAKRKAYVIAFTMAKKNLAVGLGRLSDDGKEAIRASLVNVNLPKQEMTNISDHTEEAVKQAVEMMLHGFVIYEVNDDVAHNTVYVSIVTTPKTRGKLARPAPNSIETDNLRDGLNQVIAEVRSGLVPPVGGRIITMRSSGETAFVGFGSAVVGASQNNVVQQKLRLTAQKVAAMRAKDALCGLIIGDKTSWEGSVVESMKDQVQEFESAAKDDPLARKNPADVKKLDEARQSFVSRMETTDLYRSARSGVLPPGIITKTWFDTDDAWAYAMSVYVPSVTNAAAATAREMQESTIVQPINDGSKKPSEKSVGEKPSSGFTDQDTKVQRPSKEVKPGPSGKIEPE